VRLMTGQAFFALKRPMFVGTLEFIDRMTIDAVAFRRKALALLHLRAGWGNQTDHQIDCQ